MREDEKRINKFLELLPDSVIENLFYTLGTSRIIGRYIANVLDEYKDYTIKHDLEFKDIKINKSYKLFSDALIKLQQFTVYHFFYNKNDKDTYIFYDYDFKRENPELYNKKEKELDLYLNDCEIKYKELRKLMEEYLLSNDYINLKTKKEEGMYSEANEDILLKPLGIKIKGNFIIRGKKQKKINKTDKALIYFLYYKSIKNLDECFTVKDLCKEESIGNSEGYIRNRITDLNNSVRGIITKELITTIPNFIKKEPKERGYHLNPKIIHIKPKRVKK